MNGGYDRQTTGWRRAKKKGGPYLVWNGWASEIEFLRVFKYTEDPIERSHGDTMTGTYTATPDELEGALPEGRERGLSEHIPDGAMAELANAFKLQSAVQSPGTPSTVSTAMATRDTESSVSSTTVEGPGLCVSEEVENSLENIKATLVKPEAAQTPLATSPPPASSTSAVSNLTQGTGLCVSSEVERGLA